jgi:hypothetical protein
VCKMQDLTLKIIFLGRGGIIPLAALVIFTWATAF